MKPEYQRVAYYPGCALEGTGHAYNASTKAVGKALGLELDEVKDWNCCGAMEVKNIHPMLQTYMSARNLAIAAERMGFDTVMTCRLPAIGGMRLAWYDATKVLGAMVEVYEESDLMRRFYRRVAKAAEGWTGENPIRSL